jgi:hypothetical protein
MENPQNLANGVHALLGYCVLITTSIFTHTWWIFGIVEVVLTVFVIVKEYWYDLRYETGETLQSSTEDALGYLVGNIAGWLLLLILWRLS